MRRLRRCLRPRYVWLMAAAVAVALTAGLVVPTAYARIRADGALPHPAPSTSAPAGPDRVLVLYDSTGRWSQLGGQYVTALSSMTQHLDAWVAHPVTAYLPGELDRYRAVVYLGSTYDEPIPTAFLDDVLKTRKPVLWANDNIWQLVKRAGDFSKRYGFVYKGFDHSAIDRVVYRGVILTRDKSNAFGVMDEWLTDPANATVLGTASRADGSTLPWALRSGNLTYVGEIPLTYTSDTDRYLAFADLAYDVFAPAPEPRHHELLAGQHLDEYPAPDRLRAVVQRLYAPLLAPVPSHG
jgi:uncharacterized protein YdaL